MVGASRIIGVDLNENKKDLAEKFGMTDFVNPKDVDDVVDHLVQMTSGGLVYIRVYRKRYNHAPGTGSLPQRVGRILHHWRCRCGSGNLYPPGGDLPEPYKRMMDPYASLMEAATVTTNLKLGTGIALPLERELFSQAKTLATVDRLSKGRLM